MNSETTYSTMDNEQSLSYTDKLVGIITEPTKTFEQMSSEKPGALNWFIPLIVLVIIASAMNYVLMQNPVIRDQAIQQQMKRIEISLNNAVEAGQVTQQQADAQLESIRERVEQQIDSGTVTNAIAVFVITFVMFFIVASVLFLLAKFVLKGTGNYSTALSAYGMAYYILIIQIIFMMIYALATDQLIMATSVAAFADANTKEIGGYLLNKIDPFTIWFYSIVSIALAKMFGSKTMGKYFLTVFSLWLGFSLLFFFAAKLFPLLQMFMQ